MELSMNRLIGLCILAGVISFQTDKIYAGQSGNHYEKIKAIDSTLKKLNQNQHKDVTEKRVLVDELKDIDLKLSQLVQSLQQLDTSISNKRKTIDQLNTQLAPMQKEYDKHQKLLSKHLMLHYQLGASQPLALILNQRDPALTSRLMTYLGYINQDRVRILSRVQDIWKIIRQKSLSEISERIELVILVVKL
jgi:septal ring factor EnvC (AmiA/AmiB activator)